MEEEQKEEETSLKIESLNSKEKTNQLDSLSIEQTIKEIKKNKKKNCCYFPSAHAILLILEILIPVILILRKTEVKLDGI